MSETIRGIDDPGRRITRNGDAWLISCDLGAKVRYFLFFIFIICKNYNYTFFYIHSIYIYTFSIEV